MPLFTPELEFTDDYPTIEPSLKLDFANARALDPRITFTRASTATYVGANGLIKTAGEDEPRFDHDPTTGESLGLLIEEPRTNILKGTSTAGNFTNSGGYWTIGGNRASQGSDQTAPDGTSSAFNIVYNGTAGDANIYYSDAGNNGGGEAPTSNSTVYTLSVFAKIPSGNSYIEGIRIRTYNTNHSCEFNLSTGTIVGTSEGATTNTIEAYPNGWYRCSITFTSGTDGNQGVQLYLFNSTSNTALDNSSANGESLYLWGAQMEAGSFPTSYIPTSGSTVTRAVDDASITGESFSSWYNDTEGTIVLDGNYLSSTVQSFRNGVVAQFLDSAPPPVNTHGIAIDSRNNGGATTLTTAGGTNQYFQIGTIGNDGIRRRIAAFSYGEISHAYTSDGLYPTIETSVLTPVVNSMRIGNYGGTAGFLGNGYFNRILYYPKRLTNAQLQTLTQ